MGGAVAEWIGSRSFNIVIPRSIPVAVRTRNHNWISFLSSFLTVLRWFPRGISVFSTWQNCERQNSNMIIAWFGPVICLPSITKKNWAGRAVNWERLWVPAIAWIKGRCYKFSALLLLLLLLLLLSLLCLQCLLVRPL